MTKPKSGKSAPRSKTKAPQKSRVKRWKKGHSCVTNPEITAHRDAAKRRGFNVNTGPSRLTFEAVVKHEATQAESDDLVSQFDTATIGGRSAKTSTTWATNFTNCSNLSFSKVLNRFSSSNLAAHKEVLAVLAATAEVIRSQGGTETDTEYFALLVLSCLVVLLQMSSLNSDSLQEDQSLAAATYLLSVVIKRVPVAVLKSSFSDSSKVLLGILNNKAATDTPSLLRSVIVCLAHLLRVQDTSVWSSEDTKHIYYTLLTLVVSTKAKLRKSAQQAVASVLRGLELTAGAAVPLHHPAAAQTATFCNKKIKESGGSNATVTLHVLELLRSILAVFPASSLKATCETVLQVMTLPVPNFKEVATKTLGDMFASNPKAECLSAEYNAKIIAVLYEYKPADNDVESMLSYLSTMTHAHCNLSRLDAKLCCTHLPKFFKQLMKSLQSVKLSKAAAAALSRTIEQCIAPTKDLAAQMVTDLPTGDTPVHKILRNLESGLGVQYVAAWEHVLTVFSQVFEVLGNQCHRIMYSSLRLMAEMRDSAAFQHRDLLDRTVGTAVRVMGPRNVLEAVPLLITGDDEDSLARSWLLPVMKDHMEETQLAFFASYFMPLAEKLEKKALVYKAQKSMVQFRTYDVLQHQIWALLPRFCTRPTDLVTAVPLLAKALGAAVRDRADSRLEIMHAVRLLVNHSLNNEAERAVMARYAHNFLPLLFNLYVTQKVRSSDSSPLAVLETIKVYFQVADDKLIAQYADKCYEKLSSPETAADQKHLLRDIVIGLVVYMDAAQLSNYLTMALDDLKSEDRTAQKKSYRIVEVVLSSGSASSRSVVSGRLSDIQLHLVQNLATSRPSSQAPRLRCLFHLLGKLESPAMSLLSELIPQAILCTKATGERARAAAFGLLSELARVYLCWHAQLPAKDALREYFVRLMAGLAGNNPHMIACTVLALTRVLFDFKALVGVDLLKAVVDSAALLLGASAREVVQTALGLVKAILSAFGDTLFSQFLQQIVSAILSIRESMRQHFRLKIREIFARLIRKFGYELIVGLVPESQRKLLNYIRKTQERAKRKKNEAEVEEGSDDEKPKPKPENIDEMLRASDSDDMDDDESKEREKKKNARGQAGKKSQRGGGAWLKEGGEIVDLMDASAANKVLTTRPEAASVSAQSSIKHNFKTAADGRLVITDNDETVEKNFKMRPKEDDLDQMIESVQLSSRKRKRDAPSIGDDDEDDDLAKKPKYKAGGKGIHRPLNQANGKPSNIGKEYKSKKAVGDVKKKDKLDPYAYVPLQFQNLNKRKKAKSTGQFKNLVEGARKGAKKGQKQKKKHGRK